MTSPATLDLAASEGVIQSLAAANYEGWAVWLKGETEPILEAREPDPRRVQLNRIITRPGDLQVRHADGRRLMDWDKLPPLRVQRLCWFGFPERYNQPVIGFDREPGRDLLRFIQYKKRAIQVSAAAGREPGLPEGVSRTGLLEIVLGFYDPARGKYGVSELYRIRPKASGVEFSRRLHPCWPLPFGFALAPHVLGLTSAQVPTCPLEPLPGELASWTNLNPGAT